jgi:exopolysaccharide production protein ExoZ
MNSQRKFFSTLQSSRGIAAVAVVVHHAADYLGDPRFWANDWYRRLFGFGAVGVELFFVLSGIVILWAHWEDQGQVNSFWGYAARRLRRIYPIYWIVLAAAIMVFQLRPMLGRGFERSGWVILSSILLVHVGSLAIILHVSWTLFHEIMFYVLFGAVILSRVFGYMLLSLWFGASCLMLVIPFGNPYLKEYLSPLHLLFALGMVIAIVVKRGLRLNAGMFIIPGILLLAYTCRLTLRNGLPDMHCALLAGVACFLILLDLMLFEREGRLHVPSWMNFLGDASYSIYLVHFPLLSLTARVCFSLSRGASIPLWTWLILQVLLAVGVGIGFHLAIEKPMLRQLSGIRRKRILMPNFDNQ